MNPVSFHYWKCVNLEFSVSHLSGLNLKISVIILETKWVTLNQQTSKAPDYSSNVKILQRVIREFIVYTNFWLLKLMWHFWN